ncbi:MAG: hypothetical protein K0S74_231 [Chlamydiales bacterium]|jgi:hypothetical protein|nr:hypothetical protein [Chlamydiales bacterium]
MLTVKIDVKELDASIGNQARCCNNTDVIYEITSGEDQISVLAKIRLVVDKQREGSLFIRGGGIGTAILSTYDIDWKIFNLFKRFTVKHVIPQNFYYFQF